MLRTFLIGFAAAAIFSCGQQKAPCNSSTCGLGCCDATGTCILATSSQHCGTSGNSCLACVNGQVCELGTCRGNNSSGGGSSVGGGSSTGGGSSVGGGSATGGGTGTGGGGGLCKPSTCPGGCCDLNDACVSPSNQACGLNGVACVQCTNGSVCTSGACQGGTGGGSATGGGGATGGGSSTGGGTGTGGGTSSCTGCCSGNMNPGSGGCAVGVCVPGTTSTNCGANGVACSNCTSTGATCTNQVCVGTSGGCTAYSTFPYTTQVGASSATDGTVNVALEGSTVGATAFELQLYKVDGGASSYVATGGVTFNNCRYCAFVLNGCTHLPVTNSPVDAFGTATCNGPNYLGQTGSFQIFSSSTPATTTGMLSAQLSGLKLVEWDFGSDVPIDGGSCITIGSQTLNASW